MSQTNAKFSELLFNPLCLACLTLSALFGQSHQSASAEDPIPYWTNSDGKTIQAEFVNLDSEKVVIRKGGRTFGIPMSSLSGESRKQAFKFSKELTGKLPKNAQSLILKLRTQDMYVLATYDRLTELNDALNELSSRVRNSKIRNSRRASELEEQERARLQAEVQKLTQSFETIDLESRRLRIILASSVLHYELSGLRPELVGRIDSIADQMLKLQDEQGTADQIGRAETLHTVARLLLSSTHLRRLGNAAGAARIEAEADALEKTIRAE